MIVQNLHQTNLRREILTGEVKPRIIRPILSGIPDSLKAIDRWMPWRLVWKDEKWSKIPMKLVGHDWRWGSHADVEQHRPFGQVAALIGEFKNLDGLKFVPGDDHVVLDIDNAVVGRGLKPFAASLVDTARTYGEYSPSGTGIKLVFRASIASLFGRPGMEGVTRRDCLSTCVEYPNQGITVEWLDGNRAACLTGDLVPGCPAVVNEDPEAFFVAWFEAFDKTLFDSAARERLREKADGKVGLTSRDIPEQTILEHARRARNGEAFAGLFDRGDLSAYGDDASRADLALYGMLAYWVGPDEDRLQDLFQSSALWRPKKADSYHRITIRKALDALATSFDWSGVAERMSSDTTWIDELAATAKGDDGASAFVIPNIGAGGQQEAGESEASQEGHQKPEAHRQADLHALQTALFLGRLKAKGIEVSSIEKDANKAMFLVNSCPCCEDPGIFQLDLRTLRREYTCSGVRSITWNEAARMYRVASLADGEEYRMGTPLTLLGKALATPRLPYVEGIAYFGTSTLLAAAPTAGKSALVRALIASNVKGERFLGRFRSRRAYHLYYDGEGGQDTLYSLLDLMGGRFGDDLPDPFDTGWEEYRGRCQARGREVVSRAEEDGDLKLLEEHVRIRSFVPGGLTADIIRRDVEALRREVGADANVVAYVDTFRTWHGCRPDYQENDNSFLASIVADYSKMARSANISLWMLHHTKKDGQGVAGGTYMEGGNDGVILYRKDGEGYDAARILEVRRMSRGDTTSLPPFGVVRDAVTGSLTACSDVRELKRQAVLKTLAQAYSGDPDAKLKRKDLREKVTVGNFEEFVLDCDTLGLLKSERWAGTGSPYVYSLSTLARADLLDLKAQVHDGTDAHFFAEPTPAA